MYSVEHNIAFIALVATRFSRYQAIAIQNFKKRLVTCSA